MKEQWIEDIRKKMQDHTEPAPEGLWNDINNVLSQQKIRPVPFYKKTGWYVAGIGSIAAMMALLFGLGNKSIESTGTAFQQVAMERNAAVNPSAQKTEALAYQSTDNRADKITELSSQNIKTRKNKKTLLNETFDENLPATSREEPINTDDSSSKEADTFLSLNQTPKERNGNEAVPYNASRDTYTKKTRMQPYESERNMTIGIQVANLTNTSRQMNGYGEFMRGATLPDQISTCNNADCPGTEILFGNIGKELSTHKKHKQPVKIGISVRYQFNRRFSLESGLTYSRLASELSTGSDGNYFHTDQKLDYLGIPLTASYSFWNNKRFNFYVSAGGMIEKCIAGKSDTQSFLNNVPISSEKRHIMEKPCQFSVTGAVGAQVNIISPLSFFIEPGINYYFDNGSPIETIYKSKPLNFNLNLGFRFTV